MKLGDDFRTLRRYADDVPELRTVKLSFTLTPALLARLDAYRESRRWSRSTAIAVLVEEGLDRAEGGDPK
jgi:hypothetical protein